MALKIEVKTDPVHFIPLDQVGTTRQITVDVPALEADLRTHVRGEVRFDAGTRGMYAHDGGNYRMVPLGVVLPLDADDTAAAVAACRRHGAPLHGRGGGTGIPGQTVNDGVVLDFSKYMNRVLDIDPVLKLGRVQPGCVHDTLSDAARRYDLVFGPDPATHNRCTIGGQIGNNSCGSHSQYAGRTVDNVEAMDILLYDGTRMTVGRTSDEELEATIRAGGRKGEIYAKLRDVRDRYADEIRARFPNIPRRVSGYNLDQLLPENGFHVARALVGTEGTCVTVLEATVNLVYSFPARSLLVLGYSDVFQAADHVPEIIPFNPIALESMDFSFINDMTLKGMHDPAEGQLPEGGAWLMCEFGGATKEESDAAARKLMDALKGRPNAPTMKLFDNPEDERHIWHLREEGLGATADVPGKPENHDGWEDSAVAPERLGEYLRGFKKLLDRYGYDGSLYGHFGQGCLHTRLDFDFLTASGIEKFRHFVQDAADLCASMGGSLSGEHGDGQSRGELLTRMFGKELVEAFHEFKRIWDPDWKMNPGKVVAPYRLDEHLYEGVDYNPADPPTHFEFPGEGRRFSKAANRCVGAGVCRRHHGGTMCPSYMVTLEEKHSTRGRARLLYEMVNGERDGVIKDGWKSEEVKDALDLCLACKGCKGDCPVQVDMATYKAEFLSHYYEGRVRPRHAYAFGLIHIWSRLANSVPGLNQIVNWATHLPGLSQVAKAMVGMDSRRRLPYFAPVPFKSWFRSHTPANPSGPRVILWADTFNNFYHPATAKAAVDVLESAGFNVVVPEQNLCCGRPLYDYGFLGIAKAWLQDILRALREDLERGTPVVVLEPSCASVFKDEMTNLLADDEDAKRLSGQVYLLSEFLREHAPSWKPPKLRRKALVHGHCHHKSLASLMNMGAERDLLRQMDLDVEMPDTGCCGMAGAFGFETGAHYDVSIKCGERVLLPEVRNAGKETLVIADGFSCREQISQTTDRRAVHVAQVLQMAMREGEHGPPGEYPERRYVTPPAAETLRATLQGAALLAGAAVAVWGLIALARRGGSRSSARCDRPA